MCWLWGFWLLANGALFPSWGRESRVGVEISLQLSSSSCIPPPSSLLLAAVFHLQEPAGAKAVHLCHGAFLPLQALPRTSAKDHCYHQPLLVAWRTAKQTALNTIISAGAELAVSNVKSAWKHPILFSFAQGLKLERKGPSNSGHLVLWSHCCEAKTLSWGCPSAF